MNQFNHVEAVEGSQSSIFEWLNHGVQERRGRAHHLHDGPASGSGFKDHLWDGMMIIFGKSSENIRKYDHHHHHHPHHHHHHHHRHQWEMVMSLIFGKIWDDPSGPSVIGEPREQKSPRNDWRLVIWFLWIKLDWWFEGVLCSYMFMVVNHIFQDILAYVGPHG